MAIEFFREYGELGYLANYSEYGFYKNGIFYKTVEHYYQSEKYEDEAIRQKIINAPDARSAALIGRDRNNKRKEKFRDIKLNVMLEGVLEKFRQNKDILLKLIETRELEIIEKTEDEYFWGAGRDNSGKNEFGKILMKARTILKKEIIDRIINSCDEVYILGHNHPDCDSIFSSLLLKNILVSLGKKAHFCILDTNYELAQCDEKIIIDYLPEQPEIISDVTDKKFILVDHNTLDGIPKENVVGAFDHHIISNQVENLIEMEYASTGLVIYNEFKNLYNFSGFEKFLVALTVLADTNYLCSSRFKEDDKLLYDSLNLDIDSREYQLKYFMTTDFSKGIEYVINNNLKKYNYDGISISRISIDSYNYDNIDEYVEYISSLEGNWLLIWCNYDNMTTKVWYKGNLYTYDKLIGSTYVILKDLENKGKIKKI